MCKFYIIVLLNTLNMKLRKYVFISLPNTPGVMCDMYKVQAYTKCNITSRS